MAPTESTADELWMERALGLAEASIGLASPNPVTGCVLVKNGNVIGEGFHSYADKDHAEIVALKQAGAEARGSTAYITLEPCSHHGRTPPCADALIKAGVARVVVAVRDPNPQVSGRGLDRLQAAGVSLTIGVKEAAARRLNEAFAKFIRTHRPFVTLKAGMTLDGRIAPPPTKDHIPSGSTHWITGDRSREVVQELRHAADAILTGIGTILNDDPLLTDRSGRQRRRPFLRVVLDSSLRLVARLATGPHCQPGRACISHPALDTARQGPGRARSARGAPRSRSSHRPRTHVGRHGAAGRHGNAERDAGGRLAD